MAKSEFARVIFHLTKDTFPPNADMECPFEITPALEASKWDWVGIFPVGWKTLKDYHTYQYITLEDYQSHSKSFAKVTFDASTVPQDTNFYQICFISQKLKSVCGASDAIQFSTSAGKEYVEEECEDMMVVREKTDVMREEIQDLAHKLMLANKDQEGVLQQVSILKHKLDLRDEVIGRLQGEIRNLHDLEKQERGKADMFQDELKLCTAKLKSLQKEKKEMEGAVQAEMQKVADLDSRITSLRAEMRSLLSEKDELSGQNQSLMDELDTYKTQVTESQTQVTQAGKTIAKMNASLEMAYNQCATVVEECEALKKKVAHHEKDLHHFDEQVAQLMQDKLDAESKHSDLTQELQNANDMLAACDTMKQKLSSDLDAYEQTQQKMSTKFENQESEVRSLQVQVEQKTLECAELRSKVHHLEVELAHKAREAKCAEVNLNQTLTDIQETTTRRETLVKEHAKLEKKHLEVRQQLEAAMIQVKVANNEKGVLKEQLREFEETLTESLVVKDREVSCMQKEMMEKLHQMEEKEQELEARAGMIQGLKDNIGELHSKVRSLEEELNEKQIQLEDVERWGKGHEERCVLLSRQMDALLEERDMIQEKLREVLEEEKVEQQQKEEAASQFCLWKANQALTARLLAKDKDIAALKQTMVDEQRQKQQREGEVKDLRHRLEMGKLEYQEKARENQYLHQEMKLIRNLDHTRHTRTAPRCAAVEHASSPDGILTSDSEAGEGSGSPTECEHEIKYRALRKEHKKVKKALAEKVGQVQDLQLWKENQQRELTITISDLKGEMKATAGARKVAAGADDTDSEVDVEQVDKEEEARIVRLLYGNPYSSSVETAAAHRSPTLQMIIRSTLEEEAEEDDPLSAAAGEEGNHLPPPLEPEVVPLQGAAAGADDVDDTAGEEGGQEVFEDCDPVADDRSVPALFVRVKQCFPSPSKIRVRVRRLVASRPPKPRRSKASIRDRVKRFFASTSRRPRRPSALGTFLSERANQALQFLRVTKERASRRLHALFNRVYMRAKAH